MEEVVKRHIPESFREHQSMKYPLRTRSSRRLMSSKPRFPADCMAVVYMHGYFLLLSSPYSSLLELVIPLPKTQHYAFWPQTIPSWEALMLTLTMNQLLTKKRSICLL